MIKMEILVKILPHKRVEFMQAIKDICQSHKQEISDSSLKVFQHVNDENLFYCEGEWDSNEAMEDYRKTTQFEMLIGAIQVLGEIQHARIHNIHTTKVIEL